MRDILLAVMMFAAFAFGYYVIDRFGKFFKESYRSLREPPVTDWKPYMSDTDENSAEPYEEEMNTEPDSISEDDEDDFIIPKVVDFTHH